MSPADAPEFQAPPTLVLCVDDNRDATTVTRLMIESDPTMRCVGCLDSADHLEEEVRRFGAGAPLVVLLDATMPGKDPLEVMGRLASAFPQTRTIIFSGHDGPSLVDRAMDAGAWGCVSKNDEPTAILRAVRAVAAGEFALPGKNVQVVSGALMPRQHPQSTIPEPTHGQDITERRCFP